MGEAIEILEASPVFAEDLHRPAHAGRAGRLDRHARRVGERRVDDTYGRQFDHFIMRTNISAVPPNQHGKDHTKRNSLEGDGN
jgi:hypothetical protein